MKPEDLSRSVSAIRGNIASARRETHEIAAIANRGFPYGRR